MAKKKKADKFNYTLAQKKLAKFGWKKPIKTKRQKLSAKDLWLSKAAYINHLAKDRAVAVRIGERKGAKHRIGKGRTKTYETSKLVYRFKFQPLSPRQMKLARESKIFSSAQFTPTGIFIERPLNIPASKYKVEFHGRSVEITADCRHDEIIGINPDELMSDPEGTIKEAIDSRQCLDRKGQQKKVKTFSLMVNGFRSNHSSSSLKIFVQYIKTSLLPDWLEKNEHEENPEGKFSDIFHVRLLY